MLRNCKYTVQNAYFVFQKGKKKKKKKSKEKFWNDMRVSK